MLAGLPSSGAVQTTYRWTSKTFPNHQSSSDTDMSNRYEDRIERHSILALENLKIIVQDQEGGNVCQHFVLNMLVDLGFKLENSSSSKSILDVLPITGMEVLVPTLSDISRHHRIRRIELLPLHKPHLHNYYSIYFRKIQ
jgi:hypothetical protein